MNANSRIPFTITESWTIYDRGPSMFPGLTVTPNGDLILTFCTAPDGMPGGKLCLMRSSDNGWSWSSPRVIAGSSESSGSVVNSVGIATLKNGTIILPYNNIQLHGSYDRRIVKLYLIRSEDGGHTWDKPTRIATKIYEPCTYGQILELSDGALLLPLWGRYRSGERWRSGVLISHDGGSSWNDFRTIAYNPKAHMTGPYVVSKISGFNSDGKLDPTAPFHPNFRPHSSIDGFNETSLARMLEGKIVAIMRQQGIMGSARLEFYQAISENGGETWSIPEQINICGMSPCLHWSPKGRLLLAYRRRVHERDRDPKYGVSLSWSDDCGETWGGGLILKDPKAFSYTAEYQSGYPALLNISDREMLILFYSYNPEVAFRRYLAANLILERDA